MSNIMVYWFSKDHDEIGFAERALKHLESKGLLSRQNGEEFLLEGRLGDFNGECGNRAVREPLPAALPEEAQSNGLCPRCDDDLGEAFLELHESLVAPSAFLPGEAPARQGDSARCPSCGWTGRFDEAVSGIPGEAFHLRREYLGLYDVYVDDLAPLEALADEVPDSDVLVVMTT